MARQRQGDGYQQVYGSRPLNDWGAGSVEPEYAIGDIVWVPQGCAAVLDGRVKSPGLHRVTASFSISEDAAWYYRLSPAEIVAPRGTKVVTDYDATSDRVHVIPGHCDYTAGWIKVHVCPRPQGANPAGLS